MTRDEAHNLLAALLEEGLDDTTRAEVEAHVAADPALRAEVDALRGALGELAGAARATHGQSPWASQAAPKLDAAHRRRVLDVLRPRVSLQFPRRIAAAAAVVMVSVTLIGVMLPALGTARQSARRAMVAAGVPRAGETLDYATDAPPRPSMRGSAERSNQHQLNGSLALAEGALRIDPQSPPATRSPGANGARKADRGVGMESAPPAPSEGYLIYRGKPSNVSGERPAESPVVSELAATPTPTQPRSDLALKDMTTTVTVPDGGTVMFGGQRLATATGEGRGEGQGKAGGGYAPGFTRSSGLTGALEDMRDADGTIPRFSNAPEFDLNAALSNTESGGRAGGGGSGAAGGGTFGLFADVSDSGKGVAPVDKPGSRPSTWGEDTKHGPDDGWTTATVTNGLVVDAPGRAKDDLAPGPLPQRERMQMLEQAAEQLQEAGEVLPDALLGRVQKELEAGDVTAARRALERAADKLPQDQREAFERSRLGDGEMPAKAADQAQRLETAPMPEPVAAEFKEKLQRLDRRLGLAERALPAEAVVEQAQAMQQAQQVDELRAAEEQHAPMTLKPGDRLVLGLDGGDVDGNGRSIGGSPDLAWEVTVDGHGRAQLPQELGGGKLDVSGLTLEGVEDRLGQVAQDNKKREVVAVVVPPAAVDARDAQDALVAAADPVVESELAPPPPPLIPVNPWVLTADDRLSTFALDVDRASYDVARRAIAQGQLPPVHGVRMEEFVNAFDYCYPAGRDSASAFAVHATAAPAPFAPPGQDVVLLKVGVRGRVAGRDQARPAHLVVVVDTSGSMDREDRMPLVKRSLHLMLGTLAPQDRVSIVTYETQPALLLEGAVVGDDRATIAQVIDAIQCRGATNLGAGVEVGYQLAARHFAAGAVNRVILCSDGVANVGASAADELVKMAEQYRRQGVTFTSVGFGAGSYNDRLLEQLANRGDGAYLYVGSEADAERTFVTEMSATLPVIAKDAKIQVEFDPAVVRRYRLIGYEDRDIADADFRNDAVDAGEVHSGQSATALYELELVGGLPEGAARRDRPLGQVMIRYADPDSGVVHELDHPLRGDVVRPHLGVQDDPRFYLAAAAAEFAELLRESEHAAGGNFERVSGVLEQVCNMLPLDQQAAELLQLSRQAPGLPRAR